MAGRPTRSQVIAASWFAGRLLLAGAICGATLTAQGSRTSVGERLLGLPGDRLFWLATEATVLVVVLLRAMPRRRWVAALVALWAVASLVSQTPAWLGAPPLAVGAVVAVGLGPWEWRPRGACRRGWWLATLALPVSVAAVVLFGSPPWVQVGLWLAAAGVWLVGALLREDVRAAERPGRAPLAAAPDDSLGGRTTDPDPLAEEAAAGDARPEAARASAWEYLLPVVAWAIGTAASIALIVADITGPTSTPQVTDSLIRMDGLSYVSAASDGMRVGGPSPTIDKLPGYPMLIRLTQLGIPRWNTAAVVTALAGTLLAFLLLYRWMVTNGIGRGGRVVTLAVLTTFPYGIFLFGFAYAESWFVALAVAAFLFAERDRPLAAGACAACAALVRPPGALLVLAVAAFALERARRSPPPADPASGRGPSSPRRWRAAVLVAAAGPVGYAAYCRVRWGDALAYVHGQAAISQHPPARSLTTWLLVDPISSLGADEFTLAAKINTLAQLLLVVGALAAARTIWRRFGPAHAVYVASTALVIVASTYNMSSGGRYLLGAFPLFALAGSWLARRPVLALAVVLAGAAMWVVLFTEFLHGTPYAI